MAISSQPATAGYLTMARHAMPSVPPPIENDDSDRFLSYLTIWGLLYSNQLKMMTQTGFLVLSHYLGFTVL